MWKYPLFVCILIQHVHQHDSVTIEYNVTFSHLFKKMMEGNFYIILIQNTTKKRTRNKLQAPIKYYIMYKASILWVGDEI